MEYGNLAYKEYYAPTEIKKPKKNINHKKQVARARKRALNWIAAISVLALSAGYMLCSFVEVHETQRNCAALENDLEEVQAQNSQKSFELEHAIDLGEIERIATTKLGMQRPEKYQMVYVNVHRDDALEMTAKDAKGPIKKMGEHFSALWSNIVEFFSIK